MGNDKHKCCCKCKSCKKHSCCEKKCHHENHHCNHSCDRSCMHRRCCKCGRFCNMIHFQKSNRGSRFVFKCECGRCFECICDCNGNCCCERECCCSDKDNTIKFNVTFVNENCHKKKTCNHNKNKCCKCR